MRRIPLTGNRQTGQDPKQIPRQSTPRENEDPHTCNIDGRPAADHGRLRRDTARTAATESATEYVAEHDAATVTGQAVTAVRTHAAGRIRVGNGSCRVPERLDDIRIGAGQRQGRIRRARHALHLHAQQRNLHLRACAAGKGHHNRLAHRLQERLQEFHGRGRQAGVAHLPAARGPHRHRGGEGRDSRAVLHHQGRYGCLQCRRRKHAGRRPRHRHTETDARSVDKRQQGDCLRRRDRTLIRQRQAALRRRCREGPEHADGRRRAQHRGLRRGGPQRTAQGADRQLKEGARDEHQDAQAHVGRNRRIPGRKHRPRPQRDGIRRPQMALCRKRLVRILLRAAQQRHPLHRKQHKLHVAAEPRQHVAGRRLVTAQLHEHIHQQLHRGGRRRASR